jgi:hypothetical protein
MDQVPTTTSPGCAATSGFTCPRRWGCG